MAHSRHATSDYFKKCIRRVVTEYKLTHFEEYKLSIKAVELHRQALADPKFGVAPASDMRALYEIPETLSTMLVKQLDLETTKWFKEHEGARWFAKTYREFCIPDLI